MTTFTIDIPDNNKDEIIAQLKKLGVKIRRSNLSKLDKLTKEDYEKHYGKNKRGTQSALPDDGTKRSPDEKQHHTCYRHREFAMPFNKIQQ